MIQGRDTLNIVYTSLRTGKLETKKEQAGEVSCSVRVQTDDHSGTNTVHAHAVEKSSKNCNRTPGM